MVVSLCPSRVRSKLIDSDNGWSNRKVARRLAELGLPPCLSTSPCRELFCLPLSGTPCSGNCGKLHWKRSQCSDWLAVNGLLWPEQTISLARLGIESVADLRFWFQYEQEAAMHQLQQAWLAVVASGAAFCPPLANTSGSMSLASLGTPNADRCSNVGNGHANGSSGVCINDSQCNTQETAPKRQRTLSLPAEGARKVLRQTKDGNLICQEYNHGTCTEWCPLGELHVCNGLLRNGRACGLLGHTSETCRNKRRAI